MAVVTVAPLQRRQGSAGYDDPAGRARWRMILDRVEQVQRAAARAAAGKFDG